MYITDNRLYQIIKEELVKEGILPSAITMPMHMRELGYANNWDDDEDEEDDEQEHPLEEGLKDYALAGLIGLGSMGALSSCNVEDDDTTEAVQYGSTYCPTLRTSAVDKGTPITDVQITAEMDTTHHGLILRFISNSMELDFSVITDDYIWENDGHSYGRVVMNNQNWKNAEGGVSIEKEGNLIHIRSLIIPSKYNEKWYIYFRDCYLPMPKSYDIIQTQDNQVKVEYLSRKDFLLLLQDKNISQQELLQIREKMENKTLIIRDENRNPIRTEILLPMVDITINKLNNEN